MHPPRGTLAAPIRAQQSEVISVFSLLRQGFEGHTSLHFVYNVKLNQLKNWPAIRSFSEVWWREQDSNLRRHQSTDLQSVPFDRSGISPSYACQNKTGFISIRHLNHISTKSYNLIIFSIKIAIFLYLSFFNIV